MESSIFIKGLLFIIPMMIFMGWFFVAGKKEAARIREEKK